jgi:AcrR family transcriptional regulator
MDPVQKKPGRHSQKSSTALRHQDLHGRLIAAAEAAIEATGLANLRARTLAEAAGCSVGAIYGVFPDLDTLVLVVNGRTLDAISAAMRDAGPGSEAATPAQRLVRLANAYLDYAASHRQRWRALFQHRMPEGRPITPSYSEKQVAAFFHIEGPLAEMQPGMGDEQRALLARTLFSAVHGMVELGLDEKIAAMKLPVLRAQIRMIVEAVASGLGAAPG